MGLASPRGQKNPETDVEHVIFSYHGLPEKKARSIRIARKMQVENNQDCQKKASQEVSGLPEKCRLKRIRVAIKKQVKKYQGCQKNAC
jgi:protoheme ferro-lyase